LVVEDHAKHHGLLRDGPANGRGQQAHGNDSVGRGRFTQPARASARESVEVVDRGAIGADPRHDLRGNGLEHRDVVAQQHGRAHGSLRRAWHWHRACWLRWRGRGFNNRCRRRRHRWRQCCDRHLGRHEHTARVQSEEQQRVEPDDSGNHELRTNHCDLPALVCTVASRSYWVRVDSRAEATGIRCSSSQNEDARQGNPQPLQTM
jgi:hypothetical protein